MASTETLEPDSAPIPPPSSPSIPHFSSSYLLPFSILLLSTIFAFTQSNFRQTLTPIPNPNPPYCLLWMAPFLAGGGYSSESWSYIAALRRHIPNSRFNLKISHHGDSQSLQFWQGLTDSMRDLALDLHRTRCSPNRTVVVCHSEPGAWSPPLFETSPCPPSPRYADFLAVIGRTMFETDRVSLEHVKRCNNMDQVWVPTDFHVSTFIRSGVQASKIKKLVQSIDVDFFDPEKIKPLELASLGDLVLGTHPPVDDFAFLSVFKWEYRKGWDVLLKAYLTEFTSTDDVSLHLLTNPYHTDGDFVNKIVRFVEDESGLIRPEQGWARVYIVHHRVSHVELPRLYKSADAFVLPSRGEGWGRPIVEAMAMGLPVIATNWSGPTEFMSEENGFLLVERMSEVTEGPFKGHLWAEPKVEHLRVLMRKVMENREEGKERGRRAREDMVRRFSPEVVAKILSDRIDDAIDSKISGVRK